VRRRSRDARNAEVATPDGLLLLTGACRDVTAPDPSCTITASIHIPDTAFPPQFIKLKACYRVCPEGAEAFAAAHDETLRIHEPPARGYRRLTPSVGRGAPSCICMPRYTS
jgi:hypothetical protein